MSRNGSGVYSLPSVYEVADGDTATPAQHNTPLEDLETDANTARPISVGGTGATTSSGARSNLSVYSKTETDTAISDAIDELDFVGLSDDNAFTGHNTFSKRQDWAKGADLSSASTLTLGTDGNYFDVTGTTTITAISTAQAGTNILLQFDGALTLTHNATSLKLLTGANITTVAGDMFEFVSEGSGNWRMVGKGCSGDLSAFAKTVDLASTASAKGASLIGIQDSAGNITATTVEGALAELASNGGGYCLSGGGFGATTNDAYYFGTGQSMTESDVVIPVPKAGTVTSFTVVGNVTHSDTVTLRKNGSNSGMTCSISSAGVAVTDSTHSFSVAVGDRLCARLSRNTGSATAINWSVVIQ